MRDYSHFVFNKIKYDKLDEEYVKKIKILTLPEYPNITLKELLCDFKNLETVYDANGIIFYDKNNERRYNDKF